MAKSKTAKQMKIKSIGMKYVYSSIKYNKRYIDNRDPKYQFKATLDSSPMRDFMIEKYPDEFGKGITELVCIVDSEDMMGSYHIEAREEVYKRGFNMNGIKYVRLMHSTGQARVGKVIFIKEYAYNEVVDFLRVDLKFEGEICNLTELFAYESLMASGTIDKFSLEAKNILIIEDLKVPFTDNVAQVGYDGENLTLSYKDIKGFNEANDGESLLDSSCFIDNGYEDNGSLLLRNHWYKSLGLNTEMQLFFSDNNITTLVDMFGVKHKASDIKLITTPNSLKFLKMAYKFKDKQSCYNYWIKKMSDFHIVKYDKKSKHGEMVNRLSYQMLNSLPLSYDDVRSIMGEEVKFINLLNSNLGFLKHCASMDSISDGQNFILNLLARNDEYTRTKVFKNARNTYINSKKLEIKKGHIRIKDSDYFVLAGNPLMYLQHACGLKLKSEMKGYQVSTDGFEFNKYIAGFRSPMIGAFNALAVKNVKCPHIDKYFNFSGTRVIAINTDETNVMDLLEGA